MGLIIDKPVLPRTRYAPQRIDDLADAAHVFTTPKDYYPVLYIAMLDTDSISLRKRFESETWDFSEQNRIWSTAKGNTNDCSQ